MSAGNTKRSTQEQAIHEYLQSLLFEEVPDEDVSFGADSVSRDDEPVPKKTAAVKEVSPLPLVEDESKPRVIGIEQLVAEIPETITETATETITQVVSEVKTVELKEEKVETLLESKVSVQEDEPLAAPEPEIPEWAQTRFQCLLFNVSGLNLAVPLVKLNSVIPWDENITETPNQTNWYLGLVQHLKKQVKVIDTALLVMPENRHNKLVVEAENRLSHILLVDDYKWGLACSSIGDVIWMNKDEVKWRKNKTNRAWLSGTSLKHLCAIMDTEVFAKMLTESC